MPAKTWTDRVSRHDLDPDHLRRDTPRMITNALLAFLVSPWLGAQRTDNTKACAESAAIVHDLYKKEGQWDIEFIDTAKVLSKELPVKTSDPVYSGVTMVQLGLKGRELYFPTIQVSKCSRDATFQESSMLVDKAFAIKKNGRIFSYLLFGAIGNLVKGEWQYPGFHTRVFIYDPDGSGSFSHLIPYSGELPYVPEWVRGDASIKSK